MYSNLINQKILFLLTMYKFFFYFYVPPGREKKHETKAVNVLSDPEKVHGSLS